MSESVPKAVLYHFVPGSVWSSVPVLTALEKGFTDDQLEKRTVNLLKGENFSPAFLKISPAGTVPALIVPYEHTITADLPTKFKAVHSTVAICDFLDASTLPSQHSSPSLSPATVSGSADSKALIELVHSDSAPDPNFLLMSFRSDEERKAKLASVPGAFLKGRQEALERYQKETSSNEDSRLAAFYQAKIKENGALLALYEGKGDPAEFIKASVEGWENLVKTLQTIETALKASNGRFAIGDQISLADMHVGAYLIRILAVAGAPPSSLDVAPAVTALDSQLPGGAKVGKLIKQYLSDILERDSFKKVYEGGFH